MNIHDADRTALSGSVEPLADRIAKEFAEVFNINSVATDADFFDLGGDSLMAEELAMRLTNLAGREVRISVLFDHSTAQALADHIDGGGEVMDAARMERPPIFAVHGASGYTVPKPLFFEGLEPGQKFVPLQLPGLNSQSRILETVPEIAAAYVDQIQTEWPEGRIHLSAFCDGALIAVEMARQLHELGRPVDHMVLLDPTEPRVLRNIHNGEPTRMRSRIGYALVTGNFSGGAGLKDLENVRLRRMRTRVHFLQNRLKRLRVRLKGGRDSHRYQSGQNLWAMACLRSAYRHFWPPVHDAPVDLICARERLPVHEDTTSFWHRVLPQMTVYCEMEKHHDVTGAETSAPARRMQQLFDQSEGRPIAEP